MWIAVVSLIAACQLSTPPRNRPPTITGELPALPTFAGNEEVRFTLTIDDPDRDLVNLRLASPTTAIEFLPVVNARPPVRREVRWIPGGYGARDLVFEAFDARNPSVRTRWSRRPHVGGYVPPQQVAAARLDGDDRWSIAGVAMYADLGAVTDAGCAYVWTLADPSSGGVPVLRATMHRTSPGASEYLGWTAATALHFHDVDRDGIEDVVVSAPFAKANGIAKVGVIDVWRGGADLLGTPAPWVEFTDSAGTAGDELGVASGDPVLFEDVTGDGVPDLIVGSQSASVAGKLLAGRVLVFQGGPGANAHPDPWAILERATPSTESIGLAGPNTQAIQVADVTGDGIADVVVASSLAQIGPVLRAGGVFVWQGGTTLVNTVAPLAELHLASPLGDYLTGASRGLQLADVNGDGVLDIVAASEHVRVGGIADAGAVAVWLGGASLTGSRSPDALLTIPHPHQSDRLCFTPGSSLGWAGLLLEDLNGDGIRDVIAGTPVCDQGGKVDVGALYVWFGGSSLAGATAPDAILTGAGAGAGDQVAYRFMVVEDVTGDGWPDLVASAPYSTDGGAPSVGVVHVFEGGPALAGKTASVARLGIAKPVPYTYLGVRSVVVDVTGDGIADVVVEAAALDRVAIDDGSVFVFEGGAGLRGSVTEWAELRDPHPDPNDQFGFETRVAEVTGDGIRDVICCQSNDLVPMGDHAGSAVVFAGGSTLQGTPAEFAYLHPPAPYLSFKQLRATIQPLQDWDGDGRLDVLLTSTKGAGSSFVWLAGATMAGEPPPVAILRSGSPGDQFGLAGFKPFVVPSRAATDGTFVLGATVGDVTNIDTGLLKTFQLSQGVLKEALLPVPAARRLDRLGY